MRTIHRLALTSFVSSLGLFVHAQQAAAATGVVYLHQSDFENGTLRITEPGTYKLAQDISFNPHPVGSLGEDGVTPLDAYTAGRPFFSQFGPPAAGKYDPAAYGIGFFAAIAIGANNVDLDLNGHRIEQSAEHALQQRFFSVIELADQPFVPGQGPSDFGNELVSAENVTIRNGTIGRSAHHGIHGNGNKNVLVDSVSFVDYEVGAVALNGVNGLTVRHTTAKNREDVPVIGTFSNARFISAYIDWLAAADSPTVLDIQGEVLTATAAQAQLRDAINAVYEDVIHDGLGFIDAAQHPDEYALFHNKYGVVDGNSYSFLVNPFGVAVNGFPYRPAKPSENIIFQSVEVLSQRSVVSEVIALAQNGKPAIDPVGAVFMIHNAHPDTGAPLTISAFGDPDAVYVGNVLANVQALVAKAAANGELPPFLDVSRTNITPAILDWIEQGTGLDSIASGPSDYFCNGDTMFHVNKGAIGYRVDGAKYITMQHAVANNVSNIGAIGSAICGNYTKSHPAATLSGYGGAVVRGFSFAGSDYVTILDSHAKNLSSAAGTVIGFDFLTNTRNALLHLSSVKGVNAGYAYAPNGSPSEAPDAIGVHVGKDTSGVTVAAPSVTGLRAYDQKVAVRRD